MNIRLCEMTKDKTRLFFESFEYDPDTFADLNAFTPYVYDQSHADAFYEKHRRADRKHFAVMLDEEVVGDLYLKHIDKESKSCTLSIHMKNDSVKNRGLGTQAEIFALRYAFNELGLETVYADALIKNTRSRHVLTKVGFQEIGRSESNCYYRCDQTTWLDTASL